LIRGEEKKEKKRGEKAFFLAWGPRAEKKRKKKDAAQPLQLVVNLRPSSQQTGFVFFQERVGREKRGRGGGRRARARPP